MSPVKTKKYASAFSLAMIRMGIPIMETKRMRVIAMKMDSDSANSVEMFLERYALYAEKASVPRSTTVKVVKYGIGFSEEHSLKVSVALPNVSVEITTVVWESGAKAVHKLRTSMFTVTSAIIGFATSSAVTLIRLKLGLENNLLIRCVFVKRAEKITTKPIKTNHGVI
mmetsp:Transcript_17934/g.20004  ORF Transcript_17934/g.20004 Transcript_17934/m.20004 type:complete len:169 (+) Transcript_17934:490-996(+)